MNRITKRTWLTKLLVVALLAGLCFFLGEYAAKARTWVTSVGSPHLYSNKNLNAGTVLDREGTVLLELGEKRTYASNGKTRKSTLHWLGDRMGYINASALSNYAAHMTGYNPISGVYDASEQGGEAQLTISARIQNEALSALNGRKGTVAVYNYRTGEILCAVTSPTYDPDNVPDFEADTSDAYTGVYLNRFIQSAYVPGSIFKIVTTAAALECVEDIQERTFYCNGRVKYGTEAVTCETAHGTQTLKQALANSCNCAFAQISELIGKENMVKYVERFQVAQPLRFDGVTTAKGKFDIADTASVSFAWSCIGQYNDLVNPARFLSFIGAIAAGGEGVEPYLMRQVLCAGRTTYEAKPSSGGRLMSEDTAKVLTELMRNNTKVVYGDQNFYGLNVCAKSGTSQLGGDQQPNAMFTGFIQDEQYPLAFIVVVENGGYGTHTCVPILRKVLPVCMTVLDEEAA